MERSDAIILGILVTLAHFRHLLLSVTPDKKM
jgi:hypothetical protein